MFSVFFARQLQLASLLYAHNSSTIPLSSLVYLSLLVPPLDRMRSVSAVLSIASILVTSSTTMAASTSQSEVVNEQRQLQNNNDADFFDPSRDVCDNGFNGNVLLGKCDESRFPTCERRNESLCYNRKPSRDFFHADNHQPIYYIQYDRVLCYPREMRDLCLSCAPGRYCASEQRCIMDHEDYECGEWF